MAEPDDPLRADDPLAGAEHEDVLLGSGPADDAEPAAAHPDATVADADPALDAALDDRPTTEIARVVVDAAPQQPRGRLAGLAPWGVFAAVAVVVITATTTLAGWLQGPTADREGITQVVLQPIATPTALAPPPVEAAASPSPEPEPVADPAPEPAARPTQRPRVTRAPVTPPAEAVDAPAPGTTRGQTPSKTPAPDAVAAAPSGAAGTADEKATDEKSADAKDSDKQSSDEKAKDDAKKTAEKKDSED